MQVTTSYKDIWKIAYPVIVGTIAMTIINITDTAFLGRVGEVELGASAIGGVLYFVFAMVGVSIGIGAQIMIARRNGEQNDESIGEIVDHSLILLLILSTVIFLLLKSVMPSLLSNIVQSKELVTATKAFLEYRSFGIFAVMLATVFRSFYVGIAQPRIYGFYSFIMAIVNMALGYLLIFGNLGMPKLGISGAGIASSVAETIGLLYLLIYTFFFYNYKKYNLFRFKNLSKALTLRILNLSVPLVVQNLLSMGAWFAFFIFIEKIGEHQLAISNIVRGAYMISMTPIWGFSIAANSMISNVIGQKKTSEVMPLLNKIIRMTILVAAFMILINLLFPHAVLHLFTSDEKLITDSYGCLMVVNIAMVFFSFALVSISAVSGTGATKTALIIEISAILAYMIYNYLVTFVFHGTVETLWLTEIIYWFLTGVASYYFIKSMKWIHIKV